MIRTRKPIAGGKRGGVSTNLNAISVIYSLRAEFKIDDDAPATSPYSDILGEITLVQTDGNLSIADGIMSFPQQATPAYGDQGLYSSGYTRTAGRAVFVQVKRTGGASNKDILFGWSSAANLTTGALRHGVYLSGNQLFIWENGGASTPLLNNLIADNEDYEFVIDLIPTSGAHYWVKGDVFTDWEYLWRDDINNTATMYATFSNYNATATSDYIRAGIVQRFTQSGFGFFEINVASPATLIEYTMSANAMIELTVTAPTVLANEAGMRYRISDADNYWRAYFDSAGAFKVARVVAGAEQAASVNVAGVIAGDQTRTIRINTRGAFHDAFSFSGTTPTKRGSTVNNSHVSTATGIAAEIGAGWAVANLRSTPRDASSYFA